MRAEHAGRSTPVVWKSRRDDVVAKVELAREVARDDHIDVLLASAGVVADVERRGPRQRKHDPRVAPGGQATREGLERAGTARQSRERVRDVGRADARDRMRGGGARRRDGPLDDRDIPKQRAAAGRPAEADHRRDAERVWLAQAKQSSYQLDAVRENLAAGPACAEELGHSERVEPHIDRRSRKIDPERAEHALELELVPAVEQLLGVVNRKRKPVEHDDALPAPCEVTARRGCRGRMCDGGENEAAVGGRPVLERRSIERGKRRRGSVKRVQDLRLADLSDSACDGVELHGGLT